MPAVGTKRAFIKLLHLTKRLRFKIFIIHRTAVLTTGVQCTFWTKAAPGNIVSISIQYERYPRVSVGQQGQ